MSRLNRPLRRCVATALLFVLVVTWVPVARAAGGGSLSRQYPLGTQTLCCQAGAGHSRPGSRATKRVSRPRTASTRRSSGGHGGIRILLVVVIAVIAFAPAAVILRGFSPRARRRGTRHEADPEPNPASDGADPGAPSVDAPSAPVGVAGPPSDLEEASSSEVESGEVTLAPEVSLHERGHLGSAEAAWRRAVERRHARAATRLGMALERRGDVDGASEAYRDAERWGDAAAAELAAALRRSDPPNEGSRSAEESVAE